MPRNVKVKLKVISISMESESENGIFLFIPFTPGHPRVLIRVANPIQSRRFSIADCCIFHRLDCRLDCFDFYRKSKKQLKYNRKTIEETIEKQSKKIDDILDCRFRLNYHPNNRLTKFGLSIVQKWLDWIGLDWQPWF